MSPIRFASLSLAVFTLMVIAFVMSFAMAGVLLGLTSNAILSAVLASIGSICATMCIKSSVLAISEVVVEKVSFTASKVSRFFREKKAGC